MSVSGSETSRIWRLLCGSWMERYWRVSSSGLMKSASFANTADKEDAAGSTLVVVTLENSCDEESSNLLEDENNVGLKCC